MQWTRARRSRVVSLLSLIAEVFSPPNFSIEFFDVGFNLSGIDRLGGGNKVKAMVEKRFYSSVIKVKT